jgi:cation:H+ antiporter
MAICATAPTVVLRVAGLHVPDPAAALLFGAAIVGAAFLLSWAAEVAQLDVSAGLAIAVLALIAVLPEYAVDMVFAWKGGVAVAAHGASCHPPGASGETACSLALANMTGANRLLVGFAWPVVFFLFWSRSRKRELEVGAQNATGLVFLGLATVFSFSIVARQHLSLIDTGVLMSLFVAYLLVSSRTPPAEEAPLVGPAQAIASLPKGWRWTAVVALFVFSAGTVFSAAEPFAEGLIHTGESLGIDEFILVQWVAPLASEAPEFILAALLALRGRAVAGMTVLISSKVNQWTLLVGSLPLAYAVSATSFSPMHMDSRQVEEVFLTAAQSLFAVAILLNLRLSNWEAGIMALKFAGQFLFPQPEVRWGFGAAYMVLCVRWLLLERRALGPLVRTARQAVNL